MSDTATDSPVQAVPDFVEGQLYELPPPVGWVVHEVAGKPQVTAGEKFWAWCKVEADRPGYTEIVFTKTDGSTIADPYPKPTPDAADYPVKLGAVVFKVFC